MDSTKSFSLITRALAYVCLAVFTLPATAAPVVVPDNSDGCGSGCSLDITLIYKNSFPITSNLPSILQDILSRSQEHDIEVTIADRHDTLLRDVRFHNVHSESEEEHAEDADHSIFTEYLKVKSSSAAACSSMPVELLSPESLKELFDVSSVMSFIATPSTVICDQKAVEESADESVTVSGTIAVIISDFEDGSSDRFAEITAENGDVFVVGGPNSDDAIDHAEFSAIRTGDHVEMTISAAPVTPSRPVVSTGMGMGQAIEHAPARHRLVSVNSHRKRKDADEEDKATPSGFAKVIAIRVVYTDKNPDTVCTTACLQSNLWTGASNVDASYQDASYGMLSVPQSMGAIVTVTLNVASNSYSSCNDLANIGAAADAAVAAQFPSIVLSAYTHKLYFTQAICGIGIAYVGGNPGRLYVNSAHPDTLSHEMGHNFGMQHANRDNGDDNVIDESYGDRSCIMGYSHIALRGFNIPHRIDNGWVPASAIMDLDDCTGPRTVTLSPLSQAKAAGAIVAVRAVRRRLGRYFISFRNSDGYDGKLASGLVNQVYVHYQIFAGDQTELVAVLTAGQTWSQPEGDLVVTVNSMSSAAAIVMINYCRPSSMIGVVGTLTCGSTVSGTNVGAPNRNGYASGDVLYDVELDPTVTYTFSTCGSSMDTVIRLFTDGMFKSLQLSDNSASCTSNTLNSVMSGVTGKTGHHIISVEGFNTVTGSFVLSMQCSGGVPASASRSPAAVPSATPSASAVLPSASSSSSPVPSASASASKPAPSASASASKPAASASASASKPAASASPSVSAAAPSASPSPSQAAASASPSPTKPPAVAASQSPSPSRAQVVPSVSASRSRAPVASRSPSPSPSKKANVCGTLLTGQKCKSYSQCRSCTCSKGKCK